MRQEDPSEQTADIEAMRAEVRQRHIDRHREQRGMVRDRMKRPLRSRELGLSGLLFLNACPRRMRGGAGKAVMTDLGPSKVLSLESEYVEGNRQMVGMIRVDLDTTFPSTDHAIAALQAVVDDGFMPCLPHLITGKVGLARLRSAGDEGHDVETIHQHALIRPHLWILLPRGSAVVATPDGRPEPKKLLTGVARGINLALLHLGADPNANVWLVRGKNPLHLGHWTAALNNTSYPSLTEWSGWVDTRVNAEVLARKAAEIRTGVGKSASNQAFTDLQKRAYEILRTLHSGEDGAYIAATQPEVDTEALADILHERMPLSSLDRDTAWTDEAAERIIGQVIGYAAGRWDPSRANVVQKSRGAMRHITDGMTTSKAQAASGRRTASLKKDSTLELLVEAYGDLNGRGKRVTQTAVAKASGVGRQTVCKRWDEVLKSVAFGVEIKSPQGCGEATELASIWVHTSVDTTCPDYYPDTDVRVSCLSPVPPLQTRQDDHLHPSRRTAAPVQKAPLVSTADVLSNVTSERSELPASDAAPVEEGLLE